MSDNVEKRFETDIHTYKKKIPLSHIHTKLQHAYGDDCMGTSGVQIMGKSILKMGTQTLPFKSVFVACVNSPS